MSCHEEEVDFLNTRGPQWAEASSSGPQHKSRMGRSSDGGKKAAGAGADGRGSIGADIRKGCNTNSLYRSVFLLRNWFPSLPLVFSTLLFNDPAAHQIIVRDAGFEPGTSAPMIYQWATTSPNTYSGLITHCNRLARTWIPWIFIRNIFLKFYVEFLAKMCLQWSTHRTLLLL